MLGPHADENKRFISHVNRNILYQSHVVPMWVKFIYGAHVGPMLYYCGKNILLYLH